MNKVSEGIKNESNYLIETKNQSIDNPQIDNPFIRYGIPVEIMLEIFPYLGEEALINCGKVCRDWKRWIKRWIRPKDSYRLEEARKIVNRVYSKKPEFSFERIKTEKELLKSSLELMAREKFLSPAIACNRLKECIDLFYAADELAFSKKFTHIDDHFIEWLAISFPTLHKFSLVTDDYKEEFGRIHDVGLKKLTILHPELQHLSIGRCPRLTGEGMVQALTFVNKPESLVIKSPNAVTDKLVMVVSHRFSDTLQSLTLSGECLSGTAAQALQSCDNLTSLSLFSQRVFFTAEDLHNTLRALPKLKALNLSFGLEVANDSLIRVIFSSAIPSLKSLRLYNMLGVTTAVIGTFAKSTPNLRELVLMNVQKPKLMKAIFLFHKTILNHFPQMESCHIKNL